MLDEFCFHADLGGSRSEELSLKLRQQAMGLLLVESLRVQGDHVGDVPFVGGAGMNPKRSGAPVGLGSAGEAIIRRASNAGSTEPFLRLPIAFPAVVKAGLDPCEQSLQVCSLPPDDEFVRGSHSAFLRLSILVNGSTLRLSLAAFLL